MHVRQSRIMPAIWLTHPSGTNRQHECLGVGALWDAAVPQLHARDRREARLGTALAMFVCLVSVAKSLRHQGNSSEKECLIFGSCWQKTMT